MKATHFESTPRIEIKQLKQFGCFNGTDVKGEAFIHLYGVKTQTTIEVSTKNRKMKLSYIFSGKEFSYEIPLVSAQSNLGKGIYWYFVCPVTKKRARKLYFSQGMFVHRSACKNCFYEIQTLSSISREYKKVAEALILDGIEIPKYFKPYYNGKPTKRYLRLVYDDYKTKTLIEKAQKYILKKT